MPPFTFASIAHDNPQWLDLLTRTANTISSWVWGVPLIVTICGIGIALTVALRFRHLVCLPAAIASIFKRHEAGHGEVSPAGSLCTALAATIGTGNIVGVATAIGTGGPGALFWMEVAAFFGMATKYAEGLLAVKYRKVDEDGKVLGGPFYYIEHGLGRKWKFLAVAFAIFGVLAGITGIGTIAQINGITTAVQRFFQPDFAPGVSGAGLAMFGGHYSWSTIISGILVTLCATCVIVGGIKRIAKVSLFVVPFMAIFYILTCLVLIFGNFDKIPGAISFIVKSAFDPEAVTGGAIGSIFIAMQKGIARGIFSNEAGLGSAPIAAAAAKCSHPAQQGLICMTGTFFDTIIICSMTGLAIVISGAWLPEKGLQGVNITIEAFSSGLSFLPGSKTIAMLTLMVSLSFFAFTSILGWSYYSEKCLEYLIGTKNRLGVKLYRIAYSAVIFFGPYLTVEAVWCIADIFNGLMAFPNLVALILLSPTVASCSREYLLGFDYSKTSAPSR